MMLRCVTKRVVLAILVLAMLLGGSLPCYGQVSLGQNDTFQDGTTMSWTNGFVATDPVNISTGGPAGAGDRYLQVSSGTFGGGSRLIAFNDVQWIGNYFAAGVTSVEMDLANFGASTLNMRFALRSSPGGSGTPGYVNTVAFSLPADGQWRHAIFLLDAAHLTAINSPLPLNTFLASVGDARILSSSSPSLIGDAGSGRFGVDNIAATAVPEPATWMLIIAGFSGVVCYLVQLRRQRQLAIEKVCEEPYAE